MCKRKKKTEVLGTLELHQILESIDKSELNNPRLFGEWLKDTILTPNHYVIYIEKERKQIWLLKGPKAEENYWDDANNVIRFLFNLLCTLQTLERNHSVYCVDPTFECDVLLYEKAEDFYPITDGLKYKINDDQTLERNTGEWTICQGDTKLYNECFCFKDNTYELMSKYLQNYILPTHLLSEYIQNNYRTKEEHNTATSLRRAKIGNWIAIIIGLVSFTIVPFLNTCINNHLGSTTIDKGQFDKIIEQKENIRLIRDSRSLNKFDTINCVVIEDKTKSRIKSKKQ